MVLHLLEDVLLLLNQFLILYLLGGVISVQFQKNLLKELFNPRQNINRLRFLSDLQPIPHLRIKLLINLFHGISQGILMIILRQLIMLEVPLLQSMNRLLLIFDLLPDLLNIFLENQMFLFQDAFLFLELALVVVLC